MDRNFKVGQPVIFHDANARPIPALLTAIHGSEYEQNGIKHYPCVNLVFCSLDGEKTDPYGRQIERHTSVVHKHSQSAAGMYWRWVDEEANPHVMAQK